MYGIKSMQPTPRLLWYSQTAGSVQSLHSRHHHVIIHTFQNTLRRFFLSFNSSPLATCELLGGSHIRGCGQRGAMKACSKSVSVDFVQYIRGTFLDAAITLVTIKMHIPVRLHCMGNVLQMFNERSCPNYKCEEHMDHLLASQNIYCTHSTIAA